MAKQIRSVYNTDVSSFFFFLPILSNSVERMCFNYRLSEIRRLNTVKTTEKKEPACGTCVVLAEMLLLGGKFDLKALDVWNING